MTEKPTYEELEKKADGSVDTLSMVQDLTEQEKARKKIEAVGEALRETEQRYRTLFEDSRDAIYISAREGEFVDVNQSALDLFGYIKEEMVGLVVHKIYVNPEDRVRFQQKIEARGFVRDYGAKFCKKDGTEMYCLLSSTVWRANDGSILGYQGIIRDMTKAPRSPAPSSPEDGSRRYSIRWYRPRL